MFLLPSSRASHKMPSSRFACLINHLLCRLKLFELTHSPWNTHKNIACGGHGQLWHVTCAEGRDLSNYVRMSTIQLRRPEKRQKPRNVDPKIPMKSCSTTHLRFLPSRILRSKKLSQNVFPTEMKPSKCPAEEKKNGARKATEEERKESF